MFNERFELLDSICIDQDIILFSTFLIRKRSRDDEDNDPTPISKRINNLSINPFVYDDKATTMNQQAEHQYGRYTDIQNSRRQQQPFEHVHQIDSDNDICHANDNNITENHHHEMNDDSNSFEMPNYYMHHQRQMSNQSVCSSDGHRHSAYHQNQQQTVLSEEQDTHSDGGLIAYNPDLSQDENPFYFNKNKLLFHLHIERQRRHPTT